MKNDYPKWIDEYTKAFHIAFRNMMPCSWGPFDIYSFLKFLNGSFLSKLHQAVVKIKQKNISIEEVAKSFSCPSSLRVALYWLALEYQYSEPKNKVQFKEIVEFLVKIIQFMAKKDIFAYESNIVHSPQEIKEILNTTPWQQAGSGSAREIGKLYNSLASLVFALYGDFFPQDSHEIYGPYDVSEKFGENTILVIKHFPKIRPVELWPETEELEYKDVKISQVYKNVKFKCELIGMHSIYKGNLMDNLVAYTVMADGKYCNDIEEIKKLNTYFEKYATDYSFLCDKLSKEELKKKALEWDCYQFVDFFKLAGMDWRPTQDMLEAVRDKDVPDRYESDSFPSFEEYVNSPEYEVYWLKDLYK